MSLFRGLADTLGGWFSAPQPEERADEEDVLPPLYQISWERVGGTGLVTEISLDDPGTAIRRVDGVRRFRFRSVTKEMWEARTFKRDPVRWRLAVWKDTMPITDTFDPSIDAWPTQQKPEPRAPISGDGWDTM